MYYVDVHTHLTDTQFDADRSAVIQRAEAAGVGVMIVNGTDPHSNRQTLDLARSHRSVRAAAGIYPLNAVWDRLPETLPFQVAGFDIDAEIRWIEAAAGRGELLAIGECGLDGHWVGESTFDRQEEVFCRLLEVARLHDLPVIVHSRAREPRTIDLLRHVGQKRVDFHCYGGRTQAAITAAEDEPGWYFSIPANCRRNEAFGKMLRKLPPEKILTETDAPYLSPARGQRNEPAHVVGTIEYLASLRGWTTQVARDRVWQNCCDLFRCAAP